MGTSRKHRASETTVENEELDYKYSVDFLHLNSQFRIYDALLAILSSLAGSDKAKQLQQLHETGQYLYPPPFMEYEDGED